MSIHQQQQGGNKMCCAEREFRQDGVQSGGVTSSVKCENPRPVLRGLDSQIEVQTGVHCARGTVSNRQFGALKSYVNAFFGDSPQHMLWGRWFYDRMLQWDDGPSLLYHSDPDRAERTAGRVCLDVPGSVFDRLGMWATLLFLRGLAQFDFQSSRFDGYLDDMDRTITPAQIEALTVAYSRETGHQTRNDYAGFRTVQHTYQLSKGGRLTADVLAFGRRGKEGAGRYLRIYDKRLESDGKNPAVRYELETSDRKAQVWFEMAIRAKDENELADIIAGGVVGSIDFLKRSDNPDEKNLGRLERYEFWQRILDATEGPIKLSTPQPDTEIERAVLHVQKNVTPTLVMLREATTPEDFFEFLLGLTDRKDRLSTRHEKAIDAWKEQRADNPRLSIRSIVGAFDAEGVTLPVDYWGNENGKLPEL